MTSRILFLSLFLSISLNIGGLDRNIASAEQEFFPFLAEVTTDQVNVRSGQSSNFERLCQLDKGDEVIVIAREFSWFKIQLPPSAKSFVSKNYVQRLSETVGGITADRVNIRAGAGIHFTVLGKLAKGEQIVILEELDEWYRIQPVTKSYGWVSDEFLTFKSRDVPAFAETPIVIIEEPAIPEEPQAPAVEEKSDDVIVGSIVASEDGEKFSVTGFVELYEDQGHDGIYYKIVVNGKSVCYVQGLNDMLGRFLNNRVTIEGTVNQRLQSKYPLPVIIVAKIKLML